MHLRKGRRRLAQGAAARTGKQTVVTPRMQTAQQMQHLIGPAVEMAPAFDMQDSHGAFAEHVARRTQHRIDLDHAHAGEGAVAGRTPFAGRAVERVIKHPGIGAGGLAIRAGRAEKEQARRAEGDAHVSQAGVHADQECRTVDQGRGLHEPRATREVQYRHGGRIANPCRGLALGRAAEQHRRQSELVSDPHRERAQRSSIQCFWGRVVKGQSTA
jgi:hypothetical protein